MLTYANQLTILRMIFIPCFVLLLVYGHPRAALLLFAIAAITDMLDGLLARRLQQHTALGSYLDPMADKLLITAALVTLSVPSVPVALHIPVWLTITCISRDFLIALAVLIIHLQTGHTKFPPTRLGKYTTTAQLLTIGAAMTANLTPLVGKAVFLPLVYATLALTVISGFNYFHLSVKIMVSYQESEVVGGGEGSEDPRG